MAEGKRKTEGGGNEAPGRSARPYCVLLADDNPDDRAMGVRELGKDIANLEVIHVIDRHKRAAALVEGRFDLAITDFHLRWITGLDVLRMIKAHNPQVPVIMFTGTATEEIAVEAMRLGLSDYVVKSPRQMVRLRRAVQSVLTTADEARARQRAEDQLADAELAVVASGLADRLGRGVGEADGDVHGGDDQLDDLLEGPGVGGVRVAPELHPVG